MFNAQKNLVFSGKNKFLGTKSCKTLLQNFLLFFLLLAFLHKNIVKTHFNQCLKCTAPEYWSKYTTDKVKGDRMTGDINRRRGEREREKLLSIALIDTSIE